MFLPLGSDVPLKRATRVTPVLIGISIALALAQLVSAAATPGEPDRLTETLALVPGKSPWWTWITYAFVHGGFMHLAGNCIFLFVFGQPVEDRLGRICFTALYVLGGVAAGLAEALLQGVHAIIGASGSISAIAGAFLVLFPRSGIRIFMFFIMVGVVLVPAWIFILLHVVWDFSKLGNAGNTAVGAHLGGYVFGAAIAAAGLATGLLKREGLDLFTLSRQAARRRAIREASGHLRSKSRVDPARPADPQIEAIARARADVLTRLSAGDHDGAISGYHALLRAHGNVPHACTLPRERQYEIANLIYQRADHQTAAIAYARFLETYPNDAEAPTVRLMLGMVNARYLNDPVAAKRLIADALPNLREESHSALARQLLAELG